MADAGNDARKVAMVTGASRGIGKAIAQWLAKGGYDVAITARTVHEGETREHSSTLKASNTKPLPGSLDATAALIEAEGQQALMVPADLTDFASLGAAVARVEERWGRIDVLVNNGRYIGPGHMDLVLDTPIDLLEKQLQANVLAIIVLCKLVLPGMIARGGGTIVNITSGSAYADPSAPAGQGGWGMGYGISKGAMQRIAGFLTAEHGADGIRAYNVQPNLIATERIAADMAEFGIVGGAPADVMGAVVKWMLEHPDDVPADGRTIEAQYVCHQLGLLPDWEGPGANESEIRYDVSGAEAIRIENEIRATVGIAPYELG
jgi:NAD(P)-dependent dehydrogenase (short-subunit alcohol dehydrogenase family)